MGRVIRPGTVPRVKELQRHRHGKRTCASAPKVPTGLVVTFIKKEVHHREVWRARVKFDAVVQDVADRPLTPERYVAQLRYTDASGVPITIAGESDDVRRDFVDGNETPLKVIFENLARPKTWYVQVRVRTMNLIHGARCYSSWTSWSAATQPASGALTGPPAPSGLTLTFDKVEGARRRAWRAKARLTQSGQWTPTDGDPVDVESYVFQLGVSSESDGTPLLNVRRGVVVEHDEGETYARREFHSKILGKRYYRVRARARALGRAGAWTSWTAWESPGGAPDPPTGLTWSNPTPSVLRAKWTDPVDLTDLDRYRVQVIRQTDSVVVDDGYTEGNRWTYHIPKADRTKNHRVKVRSIEDPGTLDVDEDPPTGWGTGDESSQVESTDSTDTAPFVGAIRTSDDSLFMDESGLPRCRLRTTTNLPISDANDRYIQFGTEDIDTLGAHDDSVTTDGQTGTPGTTFDLTLPAGSYLAFWRAVFGGSSGNGRRETFLHDTTGSVIHRELLPASGMTGPVRHTFMFDLEFSSTSVLRAGVYQSSGATIDLAASRLLFIRLGPL